MRGTDRRRADRRVVRTSAAAVALLLPVMGVAAAHSAPPPSDPSASPTPSGSPSPAASRTPKPEKPKKPKKKPDRTAPPAPSPGTPEAGAEGRITVTIGAENDSQVTVREDGGAIVAEGRAGGGSVTLSWTTTTGSHTYNTRATDKAGNRSDAATFTAVADADPPRLGKVVWTVGTREDTRSTVDFRTDPGSGYRVLVDGAVVAEGTAEDRDVSETVDVANGDHQAVVESVDEVGNVASRSRAVAVSIRSLAVQAEVTSRPTTRVQVVHVTATPNATRGTLRVPGEDPTEFTLRRGKATVKVRLADDIYTGVTVSLRDTQGRRGTAKLEPFPVDTSPPVLALSTDSRAGAGGRLEAAVRTEPGNRITWALKTAAGVNAETGSFTARDSTSRIEQDVDAGSYELVVKVTDDYDRSVSKTAEVRIAVDPTPIWMIVAAGLGVAVGGIALLFLLPLLIQRVYRRLAHRRDERRLVAADAARREHQAERHQVEAAWAGRASVVSDFLYGVTAGWDVGELPGLVLRPGETVRHMTVATAYESADAAGDRDGTGQVMTREGALVVTAQRLVLLGDESREWPVADVHDLVHVGDDESVLHHVGDDERWTMLSYGEPETTRLHLDHLRAEQRGEGEQHLAARRAELDGPAGREDAVDLSAWV